MTVRRSVLAVIFLALLSGSADAQRLPLTVVPEHYDLSFAIDLSRARFEGEAGIDVRVAQPTRRITLHAVELDIRAASVAAGGRTQTAAVTMNAGDQTATLTVETPIAAGRARLQLSYGAPLNANLRGLYLSRANGRSYAVTQLESTDARRAFPCFDEPAMKATFAITVIGDRGDTAISNGRMLSDTPGPGASQHTMTFSTTAKMSSYLVAIALGDFQCLEGAAEGVPIRICATPDKKALGHLALESAQEILTFLNRYHSIRYPFGKLDVVAVPDFAAGAMENVAAIFYRETDLLADARTASLAKRKTITGVLAHEMAHMWFGDLVTMRWWDDLWLNEGFATWMATRPAAAWKPEWHMEVDEALENQTAMNLDSLRSTHPLHVTVDTPDEIEAVFDPISYEKGASVVRMVESYVGADAFRRGVNAYLEKHQYANATSEDFMRAIAEASGRPVDRMIGTFVLQPGVPQVDVTTSCANGRTSVTLAQRRFYLDPAAAAEPGGTERWQIPVCFKTPGAASPSCVVFSEPAQTLPVADTCAPWVFANAGGKGYYRTAYAPDMIKSLAAAVETSLDGPERLSLVSDEWALVRAGRHSAASFLDLASGFGREPLAPVLGVVTSRLASIDAYLTTAENRPAFRAFVRSLLLPAYRAVGFARGAADSEDRRSLRNVLVAALGGLAKDPDVVSKARQAVTASLRASGGQESGGQSDPEARLDPILATTLIDIAAANGDAALFDALLEASKRASNPEERYRYLYALGSFTDPALVQRGLDYALSPELRSQDAAIYLGQFLGNDAARDRAWGFIKARWADLAPKVTIAGGDVNLAGSLASFCSAGARDDIREFFGRHTLPAAERTLKQTLERIDNCVDTKERQQAAVAAWLKGR